MGGNHDFQLNNLCFRHEVLVRDHTGPRCWIELGSGERNLGWHYNFQSWGAGSVYSIAPLRDCGRRPTTCISGWRPGMTNVLQNSGQPCMTKNVLLSKAYTHLPNIHVGRQHAYNCKSLEVLKYYLWLSYTLCIPEVETPNCKIGLYLVFFGIFLQLFSVLKLPLFTVVQIMISGLMTRHMPGSVCIYGCCTQGNLPVAAGIWWLFVMTAGVVGPENLLLESYPSYYYSFSGIHLYR